MEDTARSFKKNAVHISGPCFTVMMNFIKAMLPSLCLYNLSWYCVKQKKHIIFGREQHAYPYKTFHISLRIRKLCQEDAVLLGNKMKSPVNHKYCFLLFMLCYKYMQHRSKHHPIVERGATGQNWIPFLFGIHWFLQYHSKNGCITAYFYQTLNFPSWLTGLLSGPCSLFLPDAQIWICTVYTQDLKPKVLTQYIPILIRIYTYIYISL